MHQQTVCANSVGALDKPDSIVAFLHDKCMQITHSGNTPTHYVITNMRRLQYCVRITTPSFETQWTQAHC